jgi:hypothetical protein
MDRDRLSDLYRNVVDNGFKVKAFKWSATWIKMWQLGFKPIALIPELNF